MQTYDILPQSYECRRMAVILVFVNKQQEVQRLPCVQIYGLKRWRDILLNVYTDFVTLDYGFTIFSVTKENWVFGSECCVC